MKATDADVNSIPTEDKFIQVQRARGSVNMAIKSTNEIKDIWSFFVAKNDGNGISRDQLPDIIRSVGKNPTEMQLKDIVDKAKDSVISFVEFEKILSELPKEEWKEIEMIEAFKIFDHEGNGMISVSEMKDVLERMGMERMTEREVCNVLDIFGIEDSMIDYKKFVKRLM